MTEIKKNPALQPIKVVPKHCVCKLTLDEAIKAIYPNAKYEYKAAPGTLLPDGRFVNLIGEISAVIYAYCDFIDKKNMPLSQTHWDSMYKLKLILCL